MKALSVKEPWASLIIFGGKDTENRVWESRYRGPLVICASKGFDGTAQERREFIAEHGDTLGKALGVVEMVGCDTEMRSKWDCDGQYHHRVANARPFVTPFAQLGQLGYFDIDDAKIAEALAPRET